MPLSVSRHRTIMNIFEKEPRVHKDVFVAPSAAVIGDIEIGHGSSIWYGSILRGKLLVDIHCSIITHVSKHGLCLDNLFPISFFVTPCLLYIFVFGINLLLTAVHSLL